MKLKGNVTLITGGGKGVITPSVTGTEWKLDYDKSKAAAGDDASWSWAQALVKGEGLKNFKKVVFTIKGEAGKSAIIKQEGLDLTGTKINSEVSVDFDGTEQVIEIGLQKNKAGTKLSFDFSKEQTLMLFPDGGQPTAKGTLTIKSVVYSKEEITVVSNANAYDGVAESVVINKGFKEVDKGTYTFGEVSEAGEINVDYNIESWKFFKAPIRGENLKKLKTLTMTVKGKVGDKLLVKPYDKFEYWVIFDGKEQEIEIDISKFSYTAPTDPTVEAMTNFCVRPLEGETATGSFTLKNLTYKTSGKNISHQVGNEFICTNAWANSGTDKDYTVTENGLGEFEVAYDKKTEWGTLATQIGDIDKKFNTISITVKGIADRMLMIKDGKSEKNFKLTGGDDVITINRGADITFVGLIAEGGTLGAKGSFTIKELKFIVSKDPNVNYYESGETFAIEKGYISNDEGAYNFTQKGTAWDCEFNNTSGWSLVKFEFTGVGIENFTKLTLKMTYVANSYIFFKPLDLNALEKGYMFTTDEEETIVLDLDKPEWKNAKFDAVQKVVFFVQGTAVGNPTSGKFSIASAVFSK